MTDTQTRYAKQLDNGTFRYYYGNGAIPTKTGFIVKPKHEQLVANHYYPVSDDWTPPEPAPEGKEWRCTGKMLFVQEDPLSDSYFHYEYIAYPIPVPPPRTFSKYKIVRTLQAEGVWEQVKAWIESTPGAYDLYLAAEDISEDEQLLADGIAALKAQLGWTDEQVEAVLAASVKEGY